MKLSNEVKVGILATISLVVLFFGYNYLRGKGLFSSENTFYAEYEKVDGLLAANPVLMNGLQVGIVEQIYLKEDGSGKIMISFTVDPNVQVNSLTSANISSTGLLGDKALNLVISQPEAHIETTLMASGDTIRGVEEVALTEMALNEINPIKEKVENMLATLDSTLVAVNYLLRSSEMIETINGLSRSVESVQSSIKNIDGILANVNDFTETDLKKIGGILSNTEDLTTGLKMSLVKVDGLVSSAEKVTNNVANLELEKTVNTVNKTLATANGALAEVTTITEKINRGEGSIGLLFKDDALYNNFAIASSDLDKLLVDFKANPKRYIGLSLINFDRSKKKKKKDKANEKPIEE
ncbi:MAG: MlaD family protein [Chitinophagales bacterium]